MFEIILQSKTLPEPLSRLINMDKVKVRELHGEIHLIPINKPTDSRSILPILGMYTDGKLTVDGYLKRKYADKEIER